MKTDIITHYDLLIEENNDPVNDPKPLQEYMDKWDGPSFIDALRLDKSKSVLEIGLGTGRIAIKVIPLCKYLFRSSIMRRQPYIISPLGDISLRLRQ